MPGAVASERLIQLGKETTRGTEVAATSRHLPRPGDITWRDVTVKPVVEADFGLLDRQHSGSLAQIVRQHSEMEMTSDLSYERILYPLLAGVKGGVTPVAQAAGADGYLWTFTPPAVDDPVPDAFTLEYVERTGSTNIQQITSVYGLCRRIRISATNAAEYATIEEEWFARKSVSKAPTASIGLPTRTITPAPPFTVRFATTFAGLGAAAALSGVVVGFEWELETGIMPRWRLGSSSPDFDEYQFGARSLSLRLTMDWTATTETERTSYLQAAAVRYIRCNIVGPAIGAANYKIILDGAFQLLNPVESGSDDEGQSQTELEYVGIHDATKAAMFEVAVQNTLATLP